MKKSIWIGLLVAVGFGYFAFRGISFRDVLVTLSHARLSLIVLAIAVYLLDFFLRAFRWSIIVEPLQKSSARQLIWVLVLGFFANNILPLRIGEIVRAHFGARKLGISRTSALGTIVIERLFDMASFLAIFLVASTALPFPGYMKKGALAMGIAGVVLLCVLVLTHFRRDAVVSLFRRFPVPPRWTEQLIQMLTHFTESTIGALSWGVLWKSLILSCIIWTLEATYLMTLAHALAVPLPLLGAFFLLFALGLSVSVPQGPGFVGTFEFFGTMALSFLGIPRETGLPVILAIHGIQFILIAVFGMIALGKENLSLGSLSKTR